MAVARRVITAEPELVTTAEPQIIPTNAGLRTFASPPQCSLQQHIVPNHLFYIRNHWKVCPALDIDSDRLTVDGEVERILSFSYADLKKLPQKRFQVTFECCGNSPVPEYYTKSLRISSVMEQIKGHGIMGNAEWAGVSLRDVLEHGQSPPTSAGGVSWWEKTRFSICSGKYWPDIRLRMFKRSHPSDPPF